MIDPPRLIDDGRHPFEQALLGSARRDHGSAAAEARCIATATAVAIAGAHGAAAAATAALGSTKAATTAAVTGALGSAEVTTAATTAAALTGVAGATKAAGTVTAAIALKGLAIGLAVGLGLQGAVAVSNLDGPAHTRQAEQAVTPATPQHPTQSRSGPRTESLETNVEQAPAAEPRSVEATPTPIGSIQNSKGEPREGQGSLEPLAVEQRVTTSEDDSLDREVALLDEARRFMLARGYDRALLLLDRHQRDFPAGALGPEALVIRVQTLLGLGRRAEAQALASRYSILHPNTSVTKRLSVMLGNAP